MYRSSKCVLTELPPPPSCPLVCANKRWMDSVVILECFMLANEGLLSCRRKGRGEIWRQRFHILTGQISKFPLSLCLYNTGASICHQKKFWDCHGVNPSPLARTYSPEGRGDCLKMRWLDLYVLTLSINICILLQRVVLFQTSGAPSFSFKH